MNEQQYQQLLQDRLELLEEIKQVQADISAMGFIPADQQRYNAILQQRTMLLQRQANLESQIKNAPGGVLAQHQFSSTVAANLAALQDARQRAMEQQRLQTATRLADLQNRYGSTFGGMIAARERMMGTRFGQAIGGMAMAGGATIGGMARQGFGGTVEQARFDHEFQMLSREVAAAFKPLLEVATQIVTRARRFMEGLGEDGQNLLMAGGLALGAKVLTGGGRSVIGGLAGGLIGGAPGAVAGYMFGRGGSGGIGGAPVLAGGGGAAGGAMNMAALAGASAPFVGQGAAQASRAGFFARNSRLIKGAGVVGAAAAVYGLTPSAPTGSDEFRVRHAENADRLDQLQRDGGGEALKAEYDRLREGRTSGQKFYSFVGSTIGYAGQERDTIEELERRMIAQGITPKTGRRAMTSNEFGFEETGSAYGRGAIAYLSKYGGMEPREVSPNAAGASDAAFGAFGGGMTKPTPESESNGLLMQLLEVMTRVAANTEKKQEIR